MAHIAKALLLPFLLLVVVAAFAADATAEPKTVMTERGKLLFSDDLTQAPGKEWKTGKGKWEVSDGALKGVELKEDMHGAVMRHPMKFENVVIQYSFKLDGAKTTTLSINSAKGHACRVLITLAGFSVRKDSTDKNETDKAVVLDTKKMEIKQGVWHTLVVELQGNQMLATLDGKETIFGEHDGIKGEKANLGLTVAGESVSFKHLRVWEATANKNWEAAKAKLLEAKKKP
jgi:hypothetical protein